MLIDLEQLRSRAFQQVSYVFLPSIYIYMFLSSLSSLFGSLFLFDLLSWWMIDIEETGVRLRLTVVDTPGYGDFVNNAEAWKPILDNIEARFDAFLEQENRVNRAKMVDNRVHACIYFIEPTGHSYVSIFLPSGPWSTSHASDLGPSLTVTNSSPITTHQT